MEDTHDVVDYTDEIEKRYTEYLEQFEPQTPNDENMLRQMVNKEIQLELVQKRMMDGLQEENPRHTVQKAFADIESRLLNDYQKIQTELGISYSKRVKQKDVTEELPRIIKAGAEFLDEHSVKIVCTHCLSEPAEVEINQGYIIFHFSDDVPWRWESTCPRCNKQVILERS
jgi:hypothetical protein